MIKRMVLSFFLIWCMALTAHEADNTSYISKHIGILLERFAEQHGTEPLAPENEAFIRSIIQELGIIKPIIIRKMNRQAMLMFGRNNAFAKFDRYMFVGESFFKELSKEERRFLIGHECAHLMQNHQTIDLSLCIAFNLIAACMGITAAAKLNQWNMHPAIACTMGFICFGMLAQISNFGINMLARQQEVEADFISVTRLQNIDGGIAFLESIKKLNLYDYSKLLNRLLESHPSPEDRIALLEDIKQNKMKE